MDAMALYMGAVLMEMAMNTDLAGSPSTARADMTWGRNTVRAQKIE